MHFETGAMAAKIQCFVLVAMYWALLASLMGNSPVSASGIFFVRIVVPEWATVWMFHGIVTLDRIPYNNSLDNLYNKDVELKSGKEPGHLYKGLPCPSGSTHYALYVSVLPEAGSHISHFTCRVSTHVSSTICDMVFEYEMYGTVKSLGCNYRIYPY